MDGVSLAWGMFGAASLLMVIALWGARAGRGGSRRRRRPAPRGASGQELLAAAILRLRVRSFDRMAPGDRAAVLGLLEQAEESAALPDFRARINIMLAEMALIAGHPDRALERYRAALRWRPAARVTRTIELLERRLSPSVPVSVRLGA
jgi:hypothetical protein